MVEDWTPKIKSSLDEKITDCVENLVESVTGRGGRDLVVQIVVAPKLYRLRVSWLQGNIERSSMERLVDRTSTAESSIDPLALMIESMCQELESGSRIGDI